MKRLFTILILLVFLNGCATIQRPMPDTVQEMSLEDGAAVLDDALTIGIILDLLGIF